MKEDLTVKIEIYCPACNKKGIIKVKENIINKSSRGITAVNVAEFLICDHAFVVYIDNNLRVRDSFLYDFKFDLPKIEMEQKEEEILPQNFDVDIVKYNIIPSLMVSITKGILYGKKIVVIIESEDNIEEFVNFYKYILIDSFKLNLQFISKSKYKDHKSEYRDHLVLQGTKMISKKDKSFDLKNVKFESSVVQSLFGVYDSREGLVKIKNEFRKIHNLCEDLIEFNNDLKEKEEFTSKNAVDYIYQKYNTRIPYNYLTFLTDIIKNYFKVKLKKSTETADLLGFL